MRGTSIDPDLRYPSYSERQQRVILRRVPQEHPSRITLAVLAGDLLSGSLADRKGRIRARYMQTGK